MKQLDLPFIGFGNLICNEILHNLKQNIMSIQKKFDKKKPECKVTFKLAEDIAGFANKANLTGDFNGWDIESIPMKKIKDGGFSVSIDLKKGAEYQFKYLVDGHSWLTESEADKQVINEYQGENSVVVV
jgi:1,4-alpha-glucan branching enzyme